jgi:hypothetical protein
MAAFRITPGATYEMANGGLAHIQEELPVSAYGTDLYTGAIEGRGLASWHADGLSASHSDFDLLRLSHRRMTPNAPARDHLKGAMNVYPHVTDYGASQWAWRDRQGWQGQIFGVIHGTAAPGSTARDVFNYFMGNASGSCSHFIIGKEGECFQCADPNWAAAANCCPSAPSPAVNWFHGINANYGTWSIEILKNDSNNADILTAAQFARLVDVTKWLMSVCHTPPVWAAVTGGIMSHSFLDPVHRPGDHDPGPFDWNAFFAQIAAPPPPPIREEKYVEQQMRDEWNSVVQVPYTTGIAASWRGNYKTFNAGPPLSAEVLTVDWSGKPIVMQWFAGGFRCEWHTDGSGHAWLDCFNTVVLNTK